MKDFVKIFVVLCVCVGAFMYGRNYGQTSFKESEEYKSFIQAQEEAKFAKAELENLKAKFQNIADGAESKKQEELLGQILQVFLVDLGLKVSNPDTFTKPQAQTPTTGSAIPKADVAKPRVENTVVAVKKPEKVFNHNRLKSYEWILQNSRDPSEVKKNLGNVEIKDLNLFLKDAQPAKPVQLESIFGSYRGRIMDLNNSEYGTLSIDLNGDITSRQQAVKGSIKLYKNGQESMSKSFSTNRSFGYIGEGSTGFIIDNGNRFFQIYKIPETQQLTGYFYERLVNGTTKTIGSFSLNRVDQF